MTLVIKLRDAANYLRGSWKSTHAATGDLLDEAAGAISRLQAENERLVKGLVSIALNSCCEGCQEAKKVAMAALDWHDESITSGNNQS